MIVGPDPLAVEAGAKVLAAGGNAIDAAVTCAFAQGVVNPANTGIGGYSLLTYQPAPTGDRPSPVVSLDAPATAGSLVRPDMWLDRFEREDESGWGFVLRGRVNEHGYQSICTPGAVLGLSTALERWGTIGIAPAVEPAARLADEGFAVDERVAGHWSTRFQLSSDTTVLDYVRANPEASRIYLRPDGGPQRTGDVVRNPDYAATLRTIGTAGAGDFYGGSVAARMAADLGANASFVTETDLAGYAVRDLPPVAWTYRGFHVTSSPAPHGGPTVLAILAILEGWDLTAMEHNGADYIIRVASAMAAAFEDRNERLGDPLFVDDPGDSSAERAEVWRRRIDGGEAVTARTGPQSAGTTQVIVVDHAGNAASLTHSLGGSSGVVSPGLGFMFNNSMANFDPRPGGPNAIAAGKSRATGMAPTILQGRDGRRLVIGASGATKIIGAVVQVIVNIVDFGMTPQEAVNAPRFDCQGGLIRCHVRIPETTCEAVRRQRPIQRLASAYGGLGLAHAVAVDPHTGYLLGGADAGSSGMAMQVGAVGVGG